MTAPDREEVVCHCLQITASQVRLAIALGECETVGDVVCATDAGSGCTACHRHIRRFLGQ